MSEVILSTAGGCMRPWIWPNGKLHIEPCRLTQLRIGDIAVWLNGTHLVAHRVVAIGLDVVTTRGDSSPAVDAPVKQDHLLGRAVRFTKGPISYRLDSPLVALLTRMGTTPWAKLTGAARWARDAWLRR